jgi:hypothetical protein
MILKNVDKILNQPIFTKDGDLWFVKDVNVLMDGDITYEFRLVTQVPVKSSPNQQYYHYTRTMDETVKLVLITNYTKNNIYELLCGGAMWRGYCEDIDTMDKFISVLADKLPKY